MLVMALAGFGVNFWAWSLLAPLGSTFVERGVTSNAAMIVAVPVLVGSLGRLPAGAFTDRYGARLMMPIVTLASIIPVLFLGYFALDSFALLIVGGFCLGIAGTAFAVGVPLVTAWFPAHQRATALGIFGMGMGGTSIAGFTTIPVTQALGDRAPFLIAAVALAIYGVLAWVLIRDAPSFTPSRRSIVAQVMDTMRLPLTWQASYLYVLSFGGYVAFAVYLPTFLQNAYGLSAADAAARMGGFVIVAVICRPLGGFLADRFGAIRTVIVADVLVTSMAFLLAATPALEDVGTVAFLVMAASLGTGTAAVFGVIGTAAPAGTVGAIGGFVGAAGGVGGFLPPLILGGLWDATGSYSLGLVLLGLAALGAIVIAVIVGRSVARARTGATPEPTP